MSHRYCKAQAAEHRQRGVRGSGVTRVKDRDLLFVLRKDRRRQDRVVELLEVWKEVKATTEKKSDRDLERD